MKIISFVTSLLFSFILNIVSTKKINWKIQIRLTLRIFLIDFSFFVDLGSPDDVTSPMTPGQSSSGYGSSLDNLSPFPKKRKTEEIQEIITLKVSYYLILYQCTLLVS